MTVSTVSDESSDTTRQAQLFWTRYFAVYDTLNEARPYQAMIARQVELLAPWTGARVLDAGTGSGNLAAALVRRGVDLVGLDFCEPALVLARAKAPGATFQFGDLTQPLAFPPGTFDLITCSAVLHVLGRDQQRFALGELARALRTGGRLVVTVFADGFNPLQVYRTTLREEYRARGPAGAVAFGARYSWNTARILYYVRRIQREHQRGAYAYVNEASLAGLLGDAGLAPASVERTLAGQCVTALAIKPPAPPVGS